MDSSIKETQIIQEKLDLVTVLIVKTERYKPEHADFIIRELRKRMGAVVTYQTKFVDSIPRAKSGKFRAVICQIR